MKYIIWDWNGTLFDDIDLCIKSINKILEKYNIKRIESKEEYRSKFCFPIKQYYQNIGLCFPEVSFNQLAKEFIDIYQPESFNCRLTENAGSILNNIREKGYRQIILSASEQDNLVDQVSSYRIIHYFDNVLGINNIYAKTKIDIAKQWLNETNINPSDIVLIGDTMHDLEVAMELNCKCILYSKGHQQIGRSYSDRYKIIGNLEELTEMLSIC